MVDIGSGFACKNPSKALFDGTMFLLAAASQTVYKGRSLEQLAMLNHGRPA
ncbi:MAG: hypothetical protein HKM24_04450 [Gammaproteobacteria bacterium]|nr:hypothetical protein [Gammaproteobacteria bacterium]